MNIYFALALMLFGLLIHWAKQMLELEDAGTSVSPIAYAKAHPYRFVVTVGSCVAAVLLLSWAGQLNQTVALLTGFGGQSAFDMLRTRANNKMASLAVETGIEQKPA